MDGDVNTYWMGIDGGGSSLRVVIVDDKLTTIASVKAGSANPSSIGREEAARRVQAAIREALAQAGPVTVAGAGVGIAGASAEHAADWLHTTLGAVLPGTTIHPSADEEIALVGGRGRLDGWVLLAGTGSVAYGQTLDGRSLRVGGWGYLLGDEGSGYWIGAEALRCVTLYGDCRLVSESDLPQKVMRAIGITRPVDVIGWRYHEAQTHDVAKLAPQVLAWAEDGDSLAQTIIQRAADHLCEQGLHVQAALGLAITDVTYAGGLLTADNRLRQAVTVGLGLDAPPPVLHEPVIGAALLAKLKGAGDAH